MNIKNVIFCDIEVIQNDCPKYKGKYPCCEYCLLKAKCKNICMNFVKDINSKSCKCDIK